MCIPKGMAESPFRVLTRTMRRGTEGKPSNLGPVVFFTGESVIEQSRVVGLPSARNAQHTAPWEPTGYWKV